MNFRPFDRLPVVEWAPWWDETVERWRREGLPAGLDDRYALCEHFGLDMYRHGWFRARGPNCPGPPAYGEPIIRSVGEYERIREHLYPTDVVDADPWGRWAAEQVRGDAVVWLTLDGFFWSARGLLGIERHLYAIYDQPALMHRIHVDLAEWMLRVIERLCEVCTPDFMTFAEDMSYNHGPMLSPAQFDEFLRPYYETVVPALRERGILALVDSDGDVTAPAKWFEAAGIDGLLPLERQSGVDVARLRESHPRMRFIGHFDKRTMNRGEAAMRAEFERLLPTAAGGGYMISCDHQTPPGVSYEQYRQYLALFREYAAQAGAGV